MSAPSPEKLRCSGASRTVLRPALSVWTWGLLFALGMLRPPLVKSQTLAEFGQVKAGTFTHSSTAGTRSTSKTAHMMTSQDESTDLINRRLLEQQAGDGGAKLRLKSVPSGVPVWVDDKFVGRTPMDLTIAPGKHKIEMESSRTTAVQHEITLNKLDDRGFIFNLPARYPARIQLR